MANNFTRSSNPAFVSPALLSDHDLLAVTAQVAGAERRTTAELLALLAELDTRKLHLGEGYSSLFTYCTKGLHLSESAACGRITAARAARRFPILLARLAEGDVTLTNICLLAAHLTDDNHEALLDAARHAGRRDVERLVASLHQQPDIPATMRRMPGGGEPPKVDAVLPDCTQATQVALPSGSDAPAAKVASAVSPLPAPTRAAPRPAVVPFAADRYLLRLTIDASAHAKLERARDLLRHTIPTGDPALIVDRALTALLEQLEKRKTGRLSRPSVARTEAKGVRGRHVPAAVKRAVSTRDHGRCAFVGPHGRCGETGFLEYHHVVPFAMGGTTDAANLELRCRAHNAYEATVRFADTERRAAPGAAH